MGRSSLGGSGEAAIVLVEVVLVVLLCEFVSMRMGRYSTPAIRELYAACKHVFVSSMRHANNESVSACNTQQSHRELLSTRKHPP